MCILLIFLILCIEIIFMFYKLKYSKMIININLIVRNVFYVCEILLL